VKIDYGRFKYVLLRVSSRQDAACSKLLVRGDRRADYHDNIFKAAKQSLGDAYKVCDPRLFIISREHEPLIQDAKAFMLPFSPPLPIK
jgi:hypothetical protein